jgi:hypothetical protein
VIDYFYSVFLMLMLAVVVLGSFAFMMLGRTGYLEALTYIGVDAKPAGQGREEVAERCSIVRHASRA